MILATSQIGENPKEEKWTKMIQGMKIYNSEQVKKSLEDAGFTDIKIHKNKKRLALRSL